MTSKRRPKRKPPQPAGRRQPPKQAEEQPTPTPEELAKALMNLPADHKWQFLQKPSEGEVHEAPP